MGLFGGKNSFFRSAGRTINNTVTNPIKVVNTAVGSKIPDKIKIGGTSIGVNPLKQVNATVTDIRNAGRQAHTDWNNASRGEIGKWAAGYGQSLHNIAVAPVNLARGKKFSTESQKVWGGLHNLAGFGTSTYFGQSSTFQRVSRDKNLSKNTFGLSKNYAGVSRGSYTMNTAGTISNEDRVDSQQLGVKVAAVFAAIFGGGAALGAGGGGGAAGGTGVGLGSGAAGAGTAAAGGGTAAAATGTSLSSYLGYAGAAGIGAQVLTGKKTPQQGIAEFYAGDGGTGSFLDSIGDFLGGGPKDPSAPARAPAGFFSGGGGAGAAMESGGEYSPVIILGVAGLSIFAVLYYLEVI